MDEADVEGVRAAATSTLPWDRVVRAVRYVLLPGAAWDRHEGVHDVDFGLEFDLGDETWGVIWGLRSVSLEVVRGGLAGEVPKADRVDVSSLAPWNRVVGAALEEVAVESACAHRLAPPGREPIWIVAANIVGGDVMDIVLFGDSVLVIHDPAIAQAAGLERATRQGRQRSSPQAAADAEWRLRPAARRARSWPPRRGRP